LLGRIKEDKKMNGLSLVSLVSLYILVALLALTFILLLWWQSQVIKGKAMKNPDGSVDDWHEQKILYGMAIADVFIACPMAILGVSLILFGSKWGFYLLALDSFFFVWINTATTMTSLRFHKPKITLIWFIVFPFGAILGFAFLVWTIFHFDIIYTL
jgi:hypothetical protein